jgi:hypothetical protein
MEFDAIENNVEQAPAPKGSAAPKLSEENLSKMGS